VLEFGGGIAHRRDLLAISLIYVGLRLDSRSLEAYPFGPRFSPSRKSS